MERSEFADRLQYHLDKVGITPRSASIAAGLSPGAVGKMLAGESVSPRAKNLVALASVLQCDLADLTGSAPPTPKDNIATSLMRDVIEKTGWSASRLAREMGVTASTVTRALDPAVPFVPSGSTLDKLMVVASMHGVKPKGIAVAQREPGALVQYIAAVADGGGLPTEKQWERILALAGA